MNPESPKPERDESEMSRREFLAGTAAFAAAGLSPESAEAAPTVDEFKSFLKEIEGAEEHFDEIVEHYRESSEALRYLIFGKFRCYHGERPYIREYRNEHDFDVDCK